MKQQQLQNVIRLSMINLSKSIAIALMVGCFFFSLPAFADVYRYVDENGTIHFTNVPTDSRYQVYIHSSRSFFRPSTYDCHDYDQMIQEISDKYAVDYNLVRAVIKAESDFNPSAVSPKGAKGIMQLMPETARDMAVKNVFSPRDNIEGGVKYLRRLLKTFDNDLHLALAAYNAGENTVIAYNYKIPPYAETQQYVKKVLYYLRTYNNSRQSLSIR